VRQEKSQASIHDVLQKIVETYRGNLLTLKRQSNRLTANRCICGTRYSRKTTEFNRPVRQAARPRGGLPELPPPGKDYGGAAEPCAGPYSSATFAGTGGTPRAANSPPDIFSIRKSILTGCQKQWLAWDSVASSSENRYIMAVKSEDDQLPSDSLVQIYPNPFNSWTKISVRLQKGVRADQARVAMYNVLGQVVRTFDSGVLSSSTIHTYTWDGTNDFGRAVSSGVYFFTLTTPRGTFTTRLLLSK